jgi:hypothetical protein
MLLRHRLQLSSETRKLGKIIGILSPCGFLTVCVSLGFTDKAVESARAARKKRWICFWIIVIVVIIIVVVVVVVVLVNHK